MNDGRLRIGVLGGVEPKRLDDHAEIVDGAEAIAQLDSLDAVLALGEEELLAVLAPAVADPIEPLLVFVAPELPHRPLQVAEYLRAQERVLIVAHEPAAQRMFELLMPEAPCVLQLPGLDTDVFHPAEGVREFDVLLTADEAGRDSFLGRLHTIVHAQRERRGWRVLELAGHDAHRPSTPDYAAQLASTKLALIGPVPRGAGGRLVLQYVDTSMDRAGWHGRDEFYGYELPEVVVRDFEPADTAARYLAPIATKTLLVGELPPAHPWLRGLIVECSPEDSDERIADVIDGWVRDDERRRQHCDRAYPHVGSAAAKLVEVVREHC